MYELQLTNSDLLCQVSKEDYIFCNFYTWHLKAKKYVYCNSNQLDKQPLHIVIAKRMKLIFVEIDHIDRNKLNCQRNNLRSATKSENMMNRESTYVSGYRGVTWNKRLNKWQVIVVKDKKKHYFGLHDNIKIAALVYNKYAEKLFGNFAILNKVI